MDRRNDELAVIIIVSQLLMLQISELLSDRYPVSQENELKK
jgi:hypothetical protein